MRLFITLVLYSISIISCAIGANWPHENFKSVCSAQVGKNTNDPSLFRRDYEIGRRPLPNGNVETEHLHLRGSTGDCRIFYEVDPTTNTIVACRYEGSEQTCVLPP